MNDGKDISITTPGTFRLVYENPESWYVENKSVNVLKVFEFVKGAILRGITRPGSLVRISVTVKTNSGRSFKWSMQTHANTKGLYQFILPYSQENCPYQTIATSPYTIFIGKKQNHINVDEKYVQQGKMLVIMQ